MQNKTDLMETLEKHRQLELKNVKMCQEKEHQLKNPAAQLMLYQIRMDSTKHAHILQTLINILKEDTPEIVWDYRADRLIGQYLTEDELKTHAELEKEMIKQQEETIKSSGNPGVNMILQHIVEDEKRHHKIIMDMIKNLYDVGP